MTMKTLLPNNKAPLWYMYDNLSRALIDAGNGVALRTTQIAAGNNVTVYFLPVGHDDPSCVAIRLHGTEIVWLYDDGTVSLNSGGFRTETTKRKMNMALQPLGFRLLSIEGVWKIRKNSDGTFRDFFDGMVLEP